jgi:hypothetical protein
MFYVLFAMKQTAGRRRSAKRESASFFYSPSLSTKNKQAVNAVIRNAQHTSMYGGNLQPCKRDAKIRTRCKTLSNGENLAPKIGNLAFGG